ncbi:hypothetical protein UlMin_009321 [Ulmus minor]
MGKSRPERRDPKSQTLPPSPSHSFSSSSSSDFEFTISVSPRKSTNTWCPADELFYKGQLLPLHLSPRLSMVRTLLLASSSTSSSSDTTTTASRDSTGSSNDSHSSFNSELVLLADSCDSSRPSSVAEDDELKRLKFDSQTKKNKYFSLSRFSSVFKKDPKRVDPENVSGSSVKQVIRKYLKKVKPLYEKLSQKQQPPPPPPQKLGSLNAVSFVRSEKSTRKDHSGSSSNNNGVFSHSFSGNLRYPRKKNCVSSCPSSIRSSPSHSGVLCRPGVGGNGGCVRGYHADSSSMEELQSAIQGAIAHCKNSLIQNKTMVSNEI